MKSLPLKKRVRFVDEDNEILSSVFFNENQDLTNSSNGNFLKSLCKDGWEYKKFCEKTSKLALRRSFLQLLE